ncbi:MAG: hypothetical protein HY226_06070 [Candidatus Vogelbacteria bacterium]|nr:hypothetical protein [Candidatus Vogelbacteria bacterium]
METFNGVVPKTFRPSKPVEHFKYDPKIVYKLEIEGRAMYSRKRDGNSALAPLDANREASMLTAGINPIMPIKVAHITAELESIDKKLLQELSLPIGELVASPDKDDRDYVGSLLKSQNEDEVREMLRTGPLLHYRMFNILYLKGKRPDLSFAEIYDLMVEMTRNLTYVKPVELLNCTFDEAKAMSIANSWEGLVIYDNEFRAECRDDGKSDPKRPIGCLKWKDAIDEDFIALGCRMKDNNPTLIKDLKLYQIDPNNGLYMRCIHYGMMSDKKRAELSALSMTTTVAKRGKKVITGWFTEPFVCRLTYDCRKVKSGKLEGSRKFEVREKGEKNPDECFAPDTYPEAEYLDPEVLKLISSNN